MSLPRYPEYINSGVEWLGRIPKHWEICKFRHAFTESAEKIETEVVGIMLSVSGYRGVEVKTYDDENRRRLDDELFGYRIVRPGQLVVNTMWLNYAGLGVSENEGHVSPAYRSYWIASSFNKRFVHHMMRCDSFVRGYTKFLTGIRPNSLQMSRDDLMAFQLLRPPVDEQSAIAAFLDRETAKIDALIAEQEKLIALLAEKRQATISHAVTRGLDPNVPMKDSGVAWLGEVPAHWKVMRLKHATNAIVDCPHETPTYEVDGLYKVIRTADITEGKLHPRKMFGVSQQEYISRTRRMDLEKNDIVYGREGERWGFAAIVPENGRFCLGQRMMQFRTASTVSAQFLMWQLNARSTYRQGQMDTVGATSPHVNVGTIRNYALTKPPFDEQLAIARFLDAETTKLDALDAEAHRTVLLLRERRNALIAAAVTGQIDVRQA